MTSSILLRPAPAPRVSLDTGVSANGNGIPRPVRRSSTNSSSPISRPSFDPRASYEIYCSRSNKYLTLEGDLIVAKNRSGRDNQQWFIEPDRSKVHFGDTFTIRSKHQISIAAGKLKEVRYVGLTFRESEVARGVSSADLVASPTPSSWFIRQRKHGGCESWQIQPNYKDTIFANLTADHGICYPSTQVGAHPHAVDITRHGFGGYSGWKIEKVSTAFDPKLPYEIRSKNDRYLTADTLPFATVSTRTKVEKAGNKSQLWIFKQDPTDKDAFSIKNLQRNLYLTCDVRTTNILTGAKELRLTLSSVPAFWTIRHDKDQTMWHILPRTKALLSGIPYADHGVYYAPKEGSPSPESSNACLRVYNFATYDGWKIEPYACDVKQ